MRAVARRRARDAALTTVSFTASDAQVHSFGADAHDEIISRFGTMFFDDPVAAFTNIARAAHDLVDACASRPGSHSSPTTG